MREQLTQAFRDMFGVQNPHDFQIDVAELLLNNKSVILQAPTGSGKTYTSLFPYLYAWQTGIAFPRKCLYAVPLRVLTAQFKEDVERQIQDWPEETKPKIYVQTGAQQDDRTFEKDLVFTTVDQVLSSALCVPYSLGHRSANLNAGAVFSSYLVCDELHLFPIERKTATGAMATLIELLSTFRGTIPFLLMTATLSSSMLKSIAQTLDIEQIAISEDALKAIPSQKKQRYYHIVDQSLSARAVLERHDTRSLVICNQVQRAIDIYGELHKAVTGDPPHAGRTEVVLLHSRFEDQDRSNIEDTIRQKFSRDQLSNGSYIGVTTQAIEVGLDITCEHLHTELAPANAIVQRAGRCARYENEKGNVLIYKLPDDSTQPALPYDASLSAATWNAFQATDYQGRPLTFLDEQAIVSTVHDVADEQLLKRIKDETDRRWQRMSEAMFLGDKGGRATLIRKVDSRTILVHDEPGRIQNPYAWRGFSIYHGTLRGWLKTLLDLGNLTSDWKLKYPVEIKDEKEDSRKPPKYRWEVAHDSAHIDLSPIFVIHSAFVAYDNKRGFRLSPETPPVDISQLNQAPDTNTSRQRVQFTYSLEDYEQHIKDMYAYYQAQGQGNSLFFQMQLAGERLSQTDSDVTPEQLDLAIRLAIALHDIGKLQIEWQEWSHTYQDMIGDPVKPDMMVVHTNSKPDTNPIHKAADEALQNMPRPHHAAEGAVAAWPILSKVLNDHDTLRRAVFTAISRHHASWAASFNRYRLHPQSLKAIESALKAVDIPHEFAKYYRSASQPIRKDGALEEYLIRDDDPVQWLTYALIVRTLRLCDGHALEEKA